MSVRASSRVKTLNNPQTNSESNTQIMLLILSQNIVFPCIKTISGHSRFTPSCQLPLYFAPCHWARILGTAPHLFGGHFVSSSWAGSKFVTTNVWRTVNLFTVSSKATHQKYIILNWYNFKWYKINHRFRNWFMALKLWA